MKKIEILAPVGSVDALKAAVRCGADAVYLGQKNFSARKNSQNFEEDELCAAVSYAHRCGVKVHQALNILVFDHELADLKRCISSACRAGVDALIVQDWGVAAIVRVLAPHIKLHASTQMAIYSLAGVQMAEKMGFSRVVLARELSQKEISHIREHTNIELEVFVHGAYCMCISGQCYMSAAFGGKSGNRGQCAQPCRLPFTVSGKGENVLSLKDLCLVERMPLLQKMGIDSVKIEGRMKRPEYVAAAVTACRQARSGEKPDMETLQSVFSRSGFTAGYFDGRIDADMFGYRKKEDVVSANDVFKSLSQLYHKQTPLIPIEMNLSVEKDQPILLEITDPDGHLVSVRGE
ncbi:MAG: peptidase U32 family protein, partial [Oscillospiraceae bacterium]